MGITGLTWCDFCVWTGVDFFQQRIMFNETLWNNMLLKLPIFYFEYSYALLTFLLLMTLNQTIILCKMFKL